MKKIVFALSIILMSLQLTAQKIPPLAEDKETFVKEFSKLLEETKKTELKDLSKEFNDKIKKGTYDDTFIKDLRLISNKIIALNGKAYPQLSGVLANFMKMQALNLDQSKWSQWLNVLSQYTDATKNGETKNILKFLDFTYPLYEQKALYYSKAKSWYITSESFKLEYTKQGPIVKLGITDILGATKGDTLKIKNTQGTYNYKTKKWQGAQGTTDWTRAGMPAGDVFCSFGPYQIDMNTQAYSVDSATLTYKNYFTKNIKGRLSDKLIIDNSPEKTSYPKFSAKREDVPEQKISENVIYKGSFTLSGARIVGENTAGEPSKLLIYRPNTKTLMVNADVYNITINKPKKVSATNAEVSLYFNNDSIHHPRINLFFDLENNSLKLVKSEGSLAASKFWDSYHNVEFDADILEWNLENDFIDINTVSTSGLKAATYESKDFFNKAKIREIRGNVSYDPIAVLSIHQRKMGVDEILDDEFAKKLAPNLTVKQIKPLLFKLISEGFISWNEKAGLITINDKVTHYVMSNAKKKDFDNIRLISKTKKQNGRLDLNSKDIAIEGVKTVPISNATTTQFFPDSSKITLKKNRDMIFDGFFYCGRMDFFGKENKFEYDNFSMNIPQIDTLIINIPDGDKVDERGNPKLRPLNTVIQNVSGTIEINHPKNKSGRTELLQFPILHATANSKIYFDDTKIKSGTYQRENFFYELKPFTLDSLTQLEKRNIAFEGTLNSSDIFPVLNEPLRVQDDLSLGFSIASSENGFDIYKGKGKFFNNLKLDGKGLSGEGKIQYKTLTFQSENIDFYPDSLLAMADTLAMKESTSTYESPMLNSAKNPIKFYPYQDKLWTESTPESPFRMYNEVMALDGSITLTQNGVTGEGTADWDDATLISNQFKFKADELLADTSELIIKSLDGDKVTFNTPNVNAAVDFIKYTGYFKSNLKDSKTEFGYNQYETTLDEFFWDIKAKTLEFNAKEGSDGAPFTSLHKEQDSLTFLVKKAALNLETSIIEAKGVDEILIADSRVIPNKGKVTINPNAKLNLFENATVEASAASKKHRIEKATIEIFGKNKLKGSGQYVYKTKKTEPQYINFPSIDVIAKDSTIQVKKKKIKKQFFYLSAKGVIEEAEKFILYPNVTFYGDVHMLSSNEKLKIKGFTQIDFKSDFVSSDFYEVDSEVDPENLQMDISKAKAPNGQLVRTGIFVSKAGLEPLYTEILSNQIGPTDIPMIEVNGILSHNDKKNAYTFGLEEKIDNPDKIMAGNILDFNPSTGAIHAEGALDLGTQYGVIKEKVSGTVDVNLNDNKYTLNTSLAFPFAFDKELLEKLAFYFVEDNFDMDDADYTSKKAQLQLAEFFKEKEMTKAISEIDLNGLFAKPKSFKESFLLTDVDLYYDNDLRTYRSKGKFNLSFIGNRAIHKRISGYIELGHRMGADYFNIYLKTSLGDWLYINFDGGAANLQVVSSFEDINTVISSLDEKKRTIKGEEKNQAVLYTLGYEEKAKNFAKAMKKFASEQK